LITTKFIKKASPLMVALAILAICGGLVAATISFGGSANNSTTPSVINAAPTVALTLGAPNYAGSSQFVGDDAGVNYALSGTLPDVGSTATYMVYVTITALTGTPGVSKVTVSLPGASGIVYMAGTPMGSFVKFASPTALSLTPGLFSTGNINIQYSTAGSYTVQINLVGSAQ
jgi:hypothetical protein